MNLVDRATLEPPPPIKGWLPHDRVADGLRTVLRLVDELPPDIRIYGASFESISIDRLDFDRLFAGRPCLEDDRQVWRYAFVDGIELRCLIPAPDRNTNRGLRTVMVPPRADARTELVGAGSEA
ncbi:MAG: hypothetical protein KF777_01650 [Planctomycetaceae bacterium]|nr:hypothetical protein [Planctomycetaceae bacterium]